MLSRRCVPCLCCLAVVAEFGYCNIIVYTIILQLWALCFHIVLIFVLSVMWRSSTSMVVLWAVMETGVYYISLIGLNMLCVIGLMHTTSFTFTWVRYVLQQFCGQLPGDGIV